MKISPAARVKVNAHSHHLLLHHHKAHVTKRHKNTVSHVDPQASYESMKAAVNKTSLEAQEAARYNKMLKVKQEKKLDYESDDKIQKEEIEEMELHQVEDNIDEIHVQDSYDIHELDKTSLDVIPEVSISDDMILNQVDDIRSIVQEGKSEQQEEEKVAFIAIEKEEDNKEIGITC